HQDTLIPHASTPALLALSDACAPPLAGGEALTLAWASRLPQHIFPPHKPSGRNRTSSRTAVAARDSLLLSRTRRSGRRTARPPSAAGARVRTLDRRGTHHHRAPSAAPAHTGDRGRLSSWWGVHT